MRLLSMSSRSSMDNTPAWCSRGCGFNSCREFARFSGNSNSKTIGLPTYVLKKSTAEVFFQVSPNSKIQTAKIPFAWSRRVSKAHDLITCESKVQVIALVSCSPDGLTAFWHVTRFPPIGKRPVEPRLTDTVIPATFLPWRNANIFLKENPVCERPHSKIPTCSALNP